ncbi:MAG: cardiolipin synthase [Roseobacter sp.]|jgi:cardiolipin synthase
MFWLIATYLVVFVCAIRVLMRPHRDPAVRVAWLAVIFALPGVGVLAYLLLGETNIGAKRTERVRKVFNALPHPETLPDWPEYQPNAETEPLFRVGQSISGYKPVGGNSAELMEDSDSCIDRMVADIDNATRHVHLMFYIWLTDTNGMKMVHALKRAAGRGVAVRAMVDDLGSREMLRSTAWKDMDAAGVKLARALPIGNPILRILGGRIDLRNHRKVLVIDNQVTYCGSQNCADPAFLPKAKFAPWVDAMMRFEGPVVRQNQHLFATDWMSNYDEDISDVLLEPLASAATIGAGFEAQVIGTGPTFRAAAMTEMFASCMYAARKKLIVTTPYYVPNETVQVALQSAALRGVETSLVIPKRNDDFAVGATARSYYDSLLGAGVRLFEYKPGLLHTKSVTVDDDITLIGSANMDRRSFDLNYENNILLQDEALTTAMRKRQLEYIRDSDEVSLAEVEAWPRRRRLWNNTVAVVGPVL